MPGYTLNDSPAELRIARCQLHAVLVQVFAKGVLLIGESGAAPLAGLRRLLLESSARVLLVATEGRTG